MRLIDKDKTLEELNGGYEQALGIIEDYRYYNINDIEDAIDIVKHADEIDISKHDSELLDKVAKKLKDKYPKAINGFGMVINVDFHNNVDKIIAELKAEANQCQV